MTYDSQTFTRVSENLFKTGSGVYYARIKRKGKIHKKALGSDYVTAKRTLKSFEDEVENKASLSTDTLFQHFAEQWLEALRSKSSLKVSPLEVKRDAERLEKQLDKIVKEAQQKFKK